MKKRGGKPNSRTYTIMFKGFSTAWKTTGIFHPALSVYRSLFAKNTTVVPNIIHTNAMLLVCRRQVNMEMLWRIVGDLPEEGPQAPDMTTYTTILGAIQFAARREIRDIRIMYSGTDQFDRVLKRKEQMIKEGKRIWADVLYRWTKGQLPLDNQVVNAMARLLVDGVYDRDYYDVFALYHQTMGIPILGETHPENSKFIHRRVMRVGPEPAQAMDVPFVHEVDEDNKLLRRDKKETSVEDEEEENFDSLFDPVIPKFEQLSYLKPGNQELTLLLDACLNKTQGASAGTAYWDHLTRESSSHRVEPDRVSFLQYLRLLRVTRSSKLAARVIREQIIPSGNEDGKAFHIALSCCRRDRRNLQVFNHANLLLDLMHETLMLPDTRVLEGYLHLIRAFSHNPHVLLYLGGIEMEKDERDRTENKTLRRLGHKLQANLRLRALETLRPHFNKLHEAMNHGKPGPKARQGSVVERNGATFGLPCVKIMSQIRTLIDETLFYKESIPLGQRMILERESKMLRMYSEKATIRKFTSQLVSPTIEQRNQFRERQATIRKKLSERINGKPPKVKESSPENEDREADKPEAQAESSAQQAAKH